ncbi:MAG: DNA alkylation repair protein [Clostridiales bacterium]|nr:DNA alkylation repair protein [Clostridiales bacterium]
MNETYEECRARIFGAGQDQKVSAGFFERHVAIVNSESGALGIRTPEIKRLAKSVPIACREGVLDGFFNSGDNVFEAVQFAGMLAARKGDYAATREYLKRLIPLFGSWAHPDTIVPWLKWTDVDTFLGDFAYLLNCDGQYEVRTYIIYLMTRCLWDDRIDFTLDTLKNKVGYGQYYVDMAAAWCLSDALVKQYDKTLPLIENKTFPPFVHNKAIQKARESFRISAERKQYLNGLKIDKNR